MNHFLLSFIKSFVRIVACVSICCMAVKGWVEASLILLGAYFGFAEILGILEEIFDRRKE